MEQACSQTYLLNKRKLNESMNKNKNMCIIYHF
jgi:hypothetical protein